MYINKIPLALLLTLDTNCTIISHTYTYNIITTVHIYTIFHATN